MRVRTRLLYLARCAHARKGNQISKTVQRTTAAPGGGRALRDWTGARQSSVSAWVSQADWPWDVLSRSTHLAPLAEEATAGPGRGWAQSKQHSEAPSQQVPTGSHGWELPAVKRQAVSERGAADATRTVGRSPVPLRLQQGSRDSSPRAYAAELAAATTEMAMMKPFI